MIDALLKRVQSNECPTEKKLRELRHAHLVQLVYDLAKLSSRTPFGSTSGSAASSSAAGAEVQDDDAPSAEDLDEQAIALGRELDAAESESAAHAEAACAHLASVSAQLEKDDSEAVCSAADVDPQERQQTLLAAAAQAHEAAITAAATREQQSQRRYD